MTGNISLWKLGKRVTRLALEWKLIEDMQREGIGTQEIEARAWRDRCSEKSRREKEDLLLKRKVQWCYDM